MIFIELNRCCQEIGIDFLSTPFDLESAHFLINDCGVKQIKISSGDLTNAPLLLKIAHEGAQVILSTGMSTLDEIKIALGVLAFGYSCLDEKPSLDSFLSAYACEKNQAILRKNVTIFYNVPQLIPPIIKMLIYVAWMCWLTLLAVQWDCLIIHKGIISH